MITMKITEAGILFLITLLACGSVEEAERAEAGGADYIGISPVFSTPTKTDTGKPQGLEGVSEISEAVSLPLVGIGGLNAGNAAEVIRRGADGIAVVSAIVSAPDPEEAARELLQEIRGAEEK